MFYVSSIKNNLVGVTDTYDNVEEFYTPTQIKEISNRVNINGVSSKGIKKIDLGKALLTRKVVGEIDCSKELSFEVVDNLAKYKLLFGGEVISNGFMVIETDTNIKLVSTKIIMLDNSTPIINCDDCEGLFQEVDFTKIDFHNTNTSNVENMSGMFNDCEATLLGLSNFDTSNVKRMDYMFCGCRADSLNLSNFDTSNVKRMDYMFYDCYTKSLNLSNFNTYNVKDMDSMFKDCHATSIDLSSFDTSNVENVDCMFEYYRGTIKSTDTKLLQAYNDRRLD